ncbi:MAG: hypothetical protein H0X30_03800 [Anaerolineae bacterium]|nr:hypothetical protein [Anaerolineae bacterium]
MPDLPSALELEMLSDNELSEKISKLSDAIAETKNQSDTSGYLQKLYHALETERVRRKGSTTSHNLSD